MESYVNEKTGYRTTGVKLGDQLFTADKGFDYHAGRSVYKPNLDNYPEALAHQFAKREMSGESFKLDYQQLEKEYRQLKTDLNFSGKLTNTQIQQISNHLRLEYKFSAGMLNVTDKARLGSKTATVWLSDATLIKQFNSREGQDFDVDIYAMLPDLIYEPDIILKSDSNEALSKIYFFKYIAEHWHMVVVKHLKNYNELFAESFRITNEKELKKFRKQYKTIK
ncbi:hypothetical protein CF595_06650 [Gallibacterium anatis]|nr:hypothetical protein CF595_06650 [Gallibacterium anatis]